MMQRPRFFQSASVALLLSICCAAGAEGKAPRPLAASLSGEAATSYQSARLLFDDGDRAGALQKFKRAFELSQDQRLLWNMAVCEKELRHYARASVLIDQYLREGGNKLTSEARKNASETQLALHGFFSLVTIAGAPSGARISVDDVPVGVAPLREPIALDLGHRSIHAELEGYQPASTTLDVPGNTTATVTLNMSPEVLTGRLTVSSAGLGDIIKIDGKTVASAHWDGLLAPGVHTLRISAEGMKPYEAQVLVSAHGARTLSVTLEAEPHHRPLWPWLVGGAAVAGGLVVGGIVLLKPKEEAGSAPVGKLATVTIPAS